MAGPFTLIPTEVLQDRNMQQITDYGMAQTVAAAVIAVETGGAVTAAEVVAQSLCGFWNRADSILALASGAGTTPNIPGLVTCLPNVVANFSISVADTKFVKTGGATCQVVIPAVKGLYHVYFNNLGVLSYSTVERDITSDQFAPVALVFWDPVAGAGVLYEERHGAGRNRLWHRQNHESIGPTYEYGLTATVTNTAFSITQGAFFDEDIMHETPAAAITAGRHWHRDTGGASMVFMDGATTLYMATVGGHLQYDNGGTLTNMTTGYFCMSRVYVTGDTATPIAIGMGQAEYATLEACRGAPEFLHPGMALVDWKLLYRVIFQNVADTTPTYIEKADYRTATPRPNGDLGLIPASTVTSLPTGATAATDVQSAIAELTREKAVIGANADITSLAGLTTPLSLVQGGTAGTTAATARTSLDVYSKAESSGLAAGITIHAAVVAASTGDLTLTNSQTVDGVAVANPMRVLVKDQSAPAENGVYTVVDAAAWTRVTDLDVVGVGEVAVGAYVFVDQGTANNGTGWAILTAPATVGVEPMVWTQFNAAPAPTGAAPISVAGGVVSLTGVVPVANGGTNIAAYAIGDLVAASGVTTLAKLPSVAVGNALLSGGVGAAPVYGKIGLTTHVTGTLPIGNGGTAATDAVTARTNLGAAASGANSDITSLTGITTPITVARGGTGSATGSITGTTALTFAAGGTAQDINLNPSTTGRLLTGTFPVARRVAVPATNTTAGATGDYAADTSFLYICTSANVWRRANLGSF